MLAHMKTVTEWMATADNTMLAFFMGLPSIIWVLIGVMILDYISNILFNLIAKSSKRKAKGQNSIATFKGLIKKVLILIVVGLAALVDLAIAMCAGIEIGVVSEACCLWFIASEGLSILENAAAIGVPIPKILRKALEVMRKQGQETDENDENSNCSVVPIDDELKGIARENRH